MERIREFKLNKHKIQIKLLFILFLFVFVQFEPPYSFHWFL